MQRMVLALALACLAAPTARAGDDPPAPQKKGESQVTPAEAYQSLLKEYRDAEEAFNAAFREAKTPADQKRVFEQVYPRPEKFAGRFLAIAEKDPQAPEAIDALSWVVSHILFSPEGEKALAILARDHVRSDRIGLVCQRLVFSNSAASESFLRAVLEKNPSRDIQGMACYALAHGLMARAEQPLGSLRNIFRPQPAQAKPPGAEAEELLDRVAAKYADVKYGRGTLGAAAQGDLFEIRNLAIGKPAPEIEGQEIAGKPMKLSAFKGKVVVLDFWGNW